MLASGLSSIALKSSLPLQHHIVAMDQLGAAKIAENLLDFTALAPDDGFGLLMVVGGEPAADFDALAVPDDDGVAALEAALDPGDAGGQEALARGECRGCALVDGERAPRFERARDPALARGDRILARDEPGPGSPPAQRLERMHHPARGDDHVRAGRDRDF